MTKIRDEYVAQIHPSGAWVVKRVYGDDYISDIGHGDSLTMQQAEIAARLFIGEDQRRRAEIVEQQSAVKEFTVPA